jgi:hypothetical protein
MPKDFCSLQAIWMTHGELLFKDLLRALQKPQPLLEFSLSEKERSQKRIVRLQVRMGRWKQTATLHKGATQGTNGVPDIPTSCQQCAGRKEVIEHA